MPLSIVTPDCTSRHGHLARSLDAALCGMGWEQLIWCLFLAPRPHDLGEPHDPRDLFDPRDMHESDDPYDPHARRDQHDLHEPHDLCDPCRAKSGACGLQQLPCVEKSIKGGGSCLAGRNNGVRSRPMVYGISKSPLSSVAGHSEDSSAITSSVVPSCGILG